MIDVAMLLLRDELSSYLFSKGDSANVIIDNIGLFETSSGDSLTDNIVITIVNIEEESTLKNQSNQKKFLSNTAVYANSNVNLNLYILFTCNYAGDAYILALKRLSLIIQFLQSRNSFSYASSVGASLTTNPDILDLRFTLELFTMTFEQINHLWGSLGGRQMPSVMYKLRLIAITDRKVIREVPLIEEIETNLSPIS